MAAIDAGRVAGSRDRWYNNPLIRSITIQIVLVVAVVAFVGWIYHNTTTNLHDRGIATGFGFLGQRSGFDISTFLPTTSDIATILGLIV